MQHIAIVTAECCTLPFEDAWKKQFLLFGYTNTGRSVMLKIANHLPYIEVLANKEDMEAYGNEIYLNYIVNDFNQANKTKLKSIEITKKIPIGGFCGLNENFILKFLFVSENDRFKIKEALWSHKTFGNIRLEEIIHPKVSPITQFLFEKKLELQSWVTINDFNILENDLSSCVNIHIDAYKDQIMPCIDEEQLAKIVQPKMIFLRLYAYSSLATKNSFCFPNAELRDDCITHIAYQISGFTEPKCLHIEEFENNEASMLETLHSIIHCQNVQVVVYASDEIVTRNAMTYLTKRASLLNAKFSFSQISHFKVTETTNPQTGKCDLIHPGMERIDLINVLKKTFVSPCMVGFTLLDAIRHPNLLNRNEKTKMFDEPGLNELKNPDFVPPNHFTATSADISQYLMTNVIILAKIMNDKAFLSYLLTVSKVNDLAIRKVVENGQQKRVYGNFLRDFHENNLYHDAANIKNKNPLTVSRKRFESSFPDPPWLESPDPNTFLPPKERQQDKSTGLMSTMMILHNQKTAERQAQQKKDKDDKKKTNKKVGYSGGLVLSCTAGFYTNVRHSVPTNDWASMYPNLIIAYNLCVMREIRDSKWIIDPDVELEYIPRNDEKCDVHVKKYKGKDVPTFTPRVIKRFLALREEARQKGAESKTADEKAAYKTTEGALKASANSVYGFFGCLSSDIVSIQFASCVTQIGQFMQKTVRHQIILHGGTVVYGDTDSCFPMYPVDFSIKDPIEITKKIREQAEYVCAVCTKMFYPSKIIVENVKNPLLLPGPKKTYISKENGKKIAPKGFSMLKRDKCQFARKIGMFLGEQIINQTMKSTSEVASWLEVQLKLLPFRLLANNSELGPFVLTVELGGDYTGEDDKLALELADLYQLESGQKPIVGDRMPYVVAFFNDDRKHNKRVLPPTTFLKNKHRLDIKWYAETQIFNCLKQILSLPVHGKLIALLKKRIEECILRWKGTTITQDCSKLFFFSSNKKQKV